MTKPAFFTYGQVLHFEGHGWTVRSHDNSGPYLRLERDDGEVRELARAFVACCLKRGD